MPAKEMVTVGCRLPYGLILRLPGSAAEVTLGGPKLLIADGKKLSSSFVTTQVDAEFWATWKEAYKNSPILASHSIFEARNESEANAKGKELASEPTGFEQMPQTAAGVSKSVD